MRVVGVDIGGTFTDFMLYDTESGGVHVHKVPSTPAEPEQASFTAPRSPRTPCSSTRAQPPG
jgi:N-methylhydantoinase A